MSRNSVIRFHSELLQIDILSNPPFLNNLEEKSFREEGSGAPAGI